MSDDRRAVLEAVAYSDDPAIRPAERLKAIELLGGNEDTQLCFCSELRNLSAAEVDALNDDLLAAMVLATDDGQRRALWPEAAAAIDRVVEDRVREAMRAIRPVGVFS